MTPTFVRLNDASRFAFVHFFLFVGVMVLGRPAIAGPEISLREYAGGQIKKGVRTLGMGGDGATTGNYALVYRDAGGAILDLGVLRFSDTANFFSFSAVGLTTPTFWDGAAFYVLALSQRASDARVWTLTPYSTNKPASIGNLADS